MIISLSDKFPFSIPALSSSAIVALLRELSISSGAEMALRYFGEWYYYGSAVEFASSSISRLDLWPTSLKECEALLRCFDMFRMQP